MQSFYANGKLLLTGEYTVLDGAAALAIPTRQGQHLHVSPLKDDTLRWTSYDCHGTVWLDIQWEPLAATAPQVFVGETTIAARLVQILQAAIALRGGDAGPLIGQQLSSHLTFERQWGLGSSSTLIHCLAAWLQVDPFDLLTSTFGGSGYDLACAAAAGPLRFQRLAGKPSWEPLHWAPNWAHTTHFLYLNQKQNSREGIAHYRRQTVQEAEIDYITQCTNLLIGATHLRLPTALAPALRAKKNELPARSLQPTPSGLPQSMDHFDDLLQLLRQHERCIAQLTQQQTVQERLFPDFPGQLKSLGAWGGDFVWVVSPLSAHDCRTYFQKQGYHTLLPWSALALIK